jgi:hypothetical protein
MDPWSSFLPSLVASFLAVLFGLPFGLYVTWAGIRIVERHRHSEEAELLKQSVQALLDSIENSRKVLVTLQAMLAEGGTPFDPFLETDTWQTLRPFLVPLLREPRTIRTISAHFVTAQVQFEGGPRLRQARHRRLVDDRVNPG